MVVCFIVAKIELYMNYDNKPAYLKTLLIICHNCCNLVFKIDYYEQKNYSSWWGFSR